MKQTIQQMQMDTGRADAVERGRRYLDRHDCTKLMHLYSDNTHVKGGKSHHPTNEDHKGNFIASKKSIVPTWGKITGM